MFPDILAKFKYFSKIILSMNEYMQVFFNGKSIRSFFFKRNVPFFKKKINEKRNETKSVMYNMKQIVISWNFLSHDTVWYSF